MRVIGRIQSVKAAVSGLPGYSLGKTPESWQLMHLALLWNYPEFSVCVLTAMSTCWFCPILELSTDLWAMRSYIFW